MRAGAQSLGPGGVVVGEALHVDGPARQALSRLIALPLVAVVPDVRLAGADDLAATHSESRAMVGHPSRAVMAAIASCWQKQSQTMTAYQPTV